MTKNEIFAYTLKEKENVRFSKILESKNYVKSTYKNPDILNLANKLGQLKIELAKTDNPAIENEIISTKTTLINKLNTLGYDVSKIFPNFNCKKCLDKGILDNGNVCECLNDEYLNNLLKYSQIKLDNHPTLAEIDTTMYENNENIKKLITILSKVNKTTLNTFLICGATGTGKTYIAKSFLKTQILQNNLGLFYDINNLNQQFLNAHLSYNERDKILYDIYNCDVLIIDDLGSENIYKNVTKEYLLSMLNERQTNNKITLFTTNLTLNDIKNQYNERFFSRLLDKNIGLCWNFCGKDLRLN